MSKRLPKLICKICNEEMTPTGRVFHEEFKPYKEVLNYREFECVKCKEQGRIYKIVVGGC